MGSMQIILVLFMAATLAIIVIGVIAMAVNGKLNKNHSNKLMRLRVLFQAIAILVFVIICLLYTSPSPRDRSSSRMPSSA